MKYPAWLGQLNKRDEARRRGAGLYPGKDGWYKTIRGKKRYVAKPVPLDTALAVLPSRQAEAATIAEERPSRLAMGSTTLLQLSEMYIAHLWQRHTTSSPKKLALRTYHDYRDTLTRFVKCVGIEALAANAGPEWFTSFSRVIARKAVTSRRRDIIYLTAFFNWAGPGRHAMNFFPQPVNFGPDLVKPDESQIRTALEKQSKLYTPEQYFDAMASVRDCPLLFAAGLLGLNCAYLASDITKLPESAVDLVTGVVDFTRGKTGIKRKAVLLPDTIYALKRYLATRPQRIDGNEYFFCRDDGRRFNLPRRTGPKVRGTHVDAVGSYWSQITGMPFSGLRTTFATLADGMEDQRAVDLVMGHAIKSVRGKHYVKHFEPSRLLAVCQRVWEQFVLKLPLPSEVPISAVSLARSAASRAGKLSTRPRHRPRSGSAAA